MISRTEIAINGITRSQLDLMARQQMTQTDLPAGTTADDVIVTLGCVEHPEAPVLLGYHPASGFLMAKCTVCQRIALAICTGDEVRAGSVRAMTSGGHA